MPTFIGDSRDQYFYFFIITLCISSFMVFSDWLLKMYHTVSHTNTLKIGMKKTFHSQFVLEQ